MVLLRPCNQWRYHWKPWRDSTRINLLYVSTFNRVELLQRTMANGGGGTPTLLRNMEDDSTDEHGSHISHLDDNALFSHTQAAVEYQPCFNSRELLAAVVWFALCLIPSLVWKTPHQRPLPIQTVDNVVVTAFSHSEPFDKQTISNMQLGLLGVFLPLISQIAIQTLTVQRWSHVAGEIQATICVYLIALGLTIMCTDMIKLYCGYLRPAFFALCEFDGSECGNDDQDPRKSFPSGHASISFCGLTLLTLFLHGRFGLNCTAGEANLQMAAPTRLRKRFVSLFSLLPMGLAGFIAASRVVDNKHFPADVVGGALLGASIANYVSPLWF